MKHLIRLVAFAPELDWDVVHLKLRLRFPFFYIYEKEKKY